MTMELSIAEGARRASVAAPTWGKLEHGEVRRWKPQTLAAIARVLLWPSDFHSYVLEGKEVPYVEHAHGEDDAPVRGLVRWMADNLTVTDLAGVVSTWVASQADEAPMPNVVQLHVEDEGTEP